MAINETEFTNSQVEQRLANLLLEITRGQVGQFNKQQTAQDDIFGQLGTALQGLDTQNATTIARMNADQGTFDQVQAAELQRILGGGVATQAQKDQIAAATQSALDTGLADIRNSSRQQLEDIRDILAPARGLRADDTPIQDAGSRVSRAAVEQGSQLERALRTQQLQQELTFPLQQNQALSSMAQFQQGLQQTNRNFATQLQQQAFANRATLAQLQTGAGLNLMGNTASGANALGTLNAGFLGQQRLNIEAGKAQNSGGDFWSNLGTFGQAAGGIGGLLQGLGGIF